ncbi:MULTISPECIES: PKD domain-containing protein [unclassified Arthrobacter]|uniref:PKD domain-containing protein n=1 Tax=unclassified Arthrobacter TaxID=235627 RepID=UPI002DFE0A17|nr:MULTISPECIES: PKD domain-containing protein [unclassified Arthrobacter]MEC5190380.1 PKD repeat protein [Arthrobacter sp. MP_M4]MEC5201731.1 PKD repeat protein [Arthrobacter sp. MP_M7]
MYTRHVLRPAGVVAALLLLLGGLVSPAFARETALSATSSPMWQTNNTVRALAYAKGKVFIGGEFTAVRPPGAAAGTQETSRTYLAVVDAVSGNLLSFAPQPNGKVWSLAASEDQSRVYVGGDFTQIAGQARQRIAAIDTNTLTLVSNFRPNVSYRVATIAAQGTKVFFGGSFGAVSGAVRNRLAAVQASDGALLPWNPNANFDVKVVRPAPDGSKVYVGGAFDTLGGLPSWAVGLVDSAEGVLLPFPAATAVPPKSAGCVSIVRDIITDQNTVYFANSGDGGGCFDGTWAADLTSGALKWKNNCLGATEAIALVGGWLYKGSHAHDCSSEGDFPQVGNRYLLVQRPDNGKLAGWYPQTNAAGVTKVGPFAMATDGKQLWVGGDFTTVNGAVQQGVTRFQADPETAPTRPLTPSASSTRPGQVKVTFKATTDKDDENLTYNLYRAGSTQPILTQVIRSRFWDIPTLTFIDKNLTPGTQAAYRIEASDGTVAVQSYWTPYVTVASMSANYQDTVKGDGAGSFWRFEETSGTVAADSAGSNTGTYQSVNLGGAGILAGTTSADLTDSNSNMASGLSQAGPQTFSLESWIKTTTTSGGRIVGFGSSQANQSGSYDRHVFMQNDGKVVFGVWTGSATTVTSGAALNDGKWHHVVATMVPGRSELFVDGVSQGTNTPTAAQGYAGYWRVGADNLNGWPNQPTSRAMVGSVDEVAVYPIQLTSSDVQWHYNLGSANQAPVASFSQACTGLSCGFDASASSDSDGTVSEMAWDFGDGQTDVGTTPSHAYSAAGTFQVRLTVTDNLGSSTSVTQPVTVTAPNKAPVAALTAACDALSCAFDASTSSDADGSVISWQWDFGDGATGTGKTVTHAYTTAGSYDVKLSVTDDKGATAEATRAVTPKAAPAGSVLAKDTFARVVASGLGTADVGGAWTVLGSTSRYSVSGGVGNWIMLGAGNAPGAYLKNVTAADTDLSFQVSLDKPATGGGVYLAAVGRSVANQGEYRAKVRFTSAGKMSLAIVRTTAAGVETYLAPETVIAGLTGTNSQQLGVRIQVTGQGSTDIKAKLWATSGAEPDAWQLQATDTTAGLQAPGYTGVLLQLSGSAINAPVTARLSEYSLTTPR